MMEKLKNWIKEKLRDFLGIKHLELRLRMLEGKAEANRQKRKEVRKELIEYTNEKAEANLRRIKTNSKEFKRIDKRIEEIHELIGTNEKKLKEISKDLDKRISKTNQRIREAKDGLKSKDVKLEKKIREARELTEENKTKAKEIEELKETQELLINEKSQKSRVKELEEKIIANPKMVSKNILSCQKGLDKLDKRVNTLETWIKDLQSSN